MQRVKEDYQNNRDLSYDPNLGGTQSGLDALKGARDRIISFLERFCGDKARGISGTEEFNALSPAVQDVLRTELAALKGENISLGKVAEKSDDSRGTTEQTRPSEVIRLVNQTMKENDLPEVASTPGGRGSKAYQAESWQKTRDQGNGVEIREGDQLAEGTPDPGSVKFGKISQEAEQELQEGLDRRDFSQGGKYRQGAAGILQSTMSFLRGLQGLTPEGRKSYLEGLAGLAARTGHRNIFIPDGDDDKKIVQMVFSLLDAGIPIAQLGAGSFDQLGQAAWLLENFDSAQTLAGDELVRLLNHKTSVEDIAVHLMKSLPAQEVSRLGELIGTRLAERQYQETQRIQKAQYEAQKKDLEYEILNKRLEGQGGLRRKISGNAWNLRRLNMMNAIRETSLAGKRYLDPDSHAWKTSFDGVKNILGQEPSADTLRLVVGLMSGDLDPARDRDMIRTLRDAYLALVKLDATKQPRNIDQLMRYFRSYVPQLAVITTASGALTADAGKTATKLGLSGDDKDIAAQLASLSAAHIAQVGKTDQRSYSKNRLVRFLETNQDFRERSRIRRTGKLEEGRLVQQHLRWGDDLESQERTLNSADDPLLNLVRSLLVGSMAGDDKARQALDKIQKAKVFSETQKNFDDIRSEIDSKKRMGVPITDSDRSRLKEAYGNLEMARYSEAGMAAVASALGEEYKGLGDVYKNDVALISAKGIKGSIENAIKLLEERIEKEAPSLPGASAESYRKVLRTVRELSRNVNIIEEGEQADTVALVNAKGISLVRRYLKYAYGLYKTGALGDEANASKQIAMFILPYLIHETVEHQLNDPSLEWGDVAGYVNFGGKYGSKDSIGQALRDVIAESHSTGMIALLGGDYVSGMMRMHRLIGEKGQQMALYSYKANFYQKRSTANNSVFSMDQNDREAAVKDFMDYFSHTFADYYFEIIDAIRDGKPYQAQDLLNRKWVENRGEAGDLQKELAIGQDVYEELMGYINRAKVAAPNDRGAIAKEMEAHLTRASLKMLTVFSGRIIKTPQEIEAEREQKYREVRQQTAKVLAEQTGKQETDILAEMTAWGEQLDARKRDVLGAHATFLKSFGDLGRNSVTQQNLVDALQFFNGTGLQNLEASDFVGAEVRDVALADGSHAAAVIIPENKWDAFEKKAGHHGSLAFTEEPELFSAGILSATGILVFPSGYRPEFVDHEATHIFDLLSRATYSDKGHKGWVADVEILRELRAYFAQYRGYIAQGQVDPVMNQIVKELTANEKGDYFTQYCSMEGLDPKESGLRKAYNGKVQTMADQVATLIKRTENLGLAEQLLRQARTPQDLAAMATVFQKTPIAARSELRLAEPVVAVAASAMGRTPQGVLAEAMKLVGGAPKGVEIVLKTPTQPQYEKLVGKAGYYNEDTKEIVLNSERLAAKLATLNQLSELEQQTALAQMSADLAVVLAHEKVHVAGGDEFDAYEATRSEMRKLDPVRYANQIALIDALLAAGRGNINASQELKQDLEKIALQIMSATMNTATGIEALLNRIQSEVIIYKDAKAFESIAGLKTPPQSPEALESMALRANPQHGAILVPSVTLGDDKLIAVLDGLVKRGFSIFVYNETDLAKHGAMKLFWTGQLAGWLGKDQFMEMLRVAPDAKTGRFSMEACLANEFIKSLLNEILSLQQVASAA